jgi:hypothetical protein
MVGRGLSHRGLMTRSMVVQVCVGASACGVQRAGCIQRVEGRKPLSSGIRCSADKVLPMADS